MSGRLATGEWLLAREEAWKSFLRSHCVHRGVIHRHVFARRWRSAHADFPVLAGRESRVASRGREAVA